MLKHWFDFRAQTVVAVGHGSSSPTVFFQKRKKYFFYTIVTIRLVNLIFFKLPMPYTMVRIQHSSVALVVSSQSYQTPLNFPAMFREAASTD